MLWAWIAVVLVAAVIVGAAAPRARRWRGGRSYEPRHQLAASPPLQVIPVPAPAAAPAPPAAPVPAPPAGDHLVFLDRRIPDAGNVILRPAPEPEPGGRHHREPGPGEDETGGLWSGMMPAPDGGQEEDGADEAS